MNLNKLFPHLSIRAKLAIAFVLVALVPLAGVAIITTRMTVDRLQTMTSRTMDRDVVLARAEVERTLHRIEADAMFLKEAFLGRLVLGDSTPAGTQATVDNFVNRAPFLFRVKAIDADGLVVYEAGTGTGTPGGSGFYYSWQAERMTPGQTLFHPVEVRGTGAGDSARASIPAVAVLVPVHDPGGRLRGVIVGEARAATVFEGLALVAPATPGASVSLLDADGLLLYHSEHKRDWENLLAERAGETELSAHIANLGQAGAQFRTNSHLVSMVPIDLGPAGGSLTLVRAVALEALNTPVRQFLGWVGITGAVVLALVIALATLAARQLTRPIYQLQEAASRLAAGGDVSNLAVDTNDELEDLARDFGEMAAVLASQRRQLEEIVSSQGQQLAQTHAELSDILAHSADAIIGLDPAGRIRVWNQGAERLFGYSPEDALGRDADLLLPQGREHQVEREFLRRGMEEHGEVVNYQTRRRAKDGRIIPVSLTQTAVRGAQDGQMGSSLILRDITLQAQLEEHMRRSERLATMSLLAAGLAHEINNPLAVIGNRLELLALAVTRGGHHDLQQDVTVLRAHTTRLSDLTRTLLRFAGDPDETAGPVSLPTILARVQSLLERTFTARNTRLEITDAQNAVVLGTPSALETVCLNLVLNAADAMPDGGTVTMAVRRDAGAAQLFVTHEGTGVPEGLRERIFEPFFTTKGPQRGTGLGLALCRTIAGHHHGRIWVEPNQPKGSRFIVELPLAETVS